MSTSPSCHLPPHRRGFTLLEMLIALTVLAALSAIIIPSFQDDSQLRLMAATSVLASDIEFAQVLNITHPDDPVIVQFDPANHRYWLAYADAPDDPLVRQDTGEPYLITFGFGRARTAGDVSIWLVDMIDARLAFNPHGGLSDFTAQPQISLGLSGEYRTLSIAASTGSITEIESAPEGWTPPAE